MRLVVLLAVVASAAGLRELDEGRALELELVLVLARFDDTAVNLLRLLVHLVQVEANILLRDGRIVAKEALPWFRDRVLRNMSLSCVHRVELFTAHLTLPYVIAMDVVDVRFQSGAAREILSTIGTNASFNISNFVLTEHVNL